MTRFVIAFFVLFFLSFSSKSQVVIAEQDTVDVVKEENVIKTKSTQQESVVTDVIYQHDGKKLLVDVKKVYLNDIYYSLSGETKVNKMDQRLVHKIEYKSGKVEVLNETPPDVRKVGDYRKVKVTKDPDDVEGLIEVAKLEALAEGSDRGGYTTPKTLERTATIVLRRKAALVNADIVLITDKKTQVAFGEQPTVTLYGTAYSYR